MPARVPGRQFSDPENGLEMRPKMGVEEGVGKEGFNYVIVSNTRGQLASQPASIEQIPHKI